MSASFRDATNRPGSDVLKNPIDDRLSPLILTAKSLNTNPSTALEIPKANKRMYESVSPSKPPDNEGSPAGGQEAGEQEESSAGSMNGMSFAM